ncbi:MAG: glycosyl hydrolase family 3 [Synechococcus sp. MED-G71]|nr:MAG: glycosyl hydrolase family 3 [Synechococcus sp. MED-G71]
MSLRRQLAELLVLRCSGHQLDQQRRYPQWELSNSELRHWLSEGVGGVILLGGSAAELALRCRQLQQWARTPLLLCADVEEGVGQRFDGASWLAPPLALAGLHRRDPAAATALARAYGRCTALEARALGLNWVLGPVCDVNNNPANPVINVRAWAETAESAAALSQAFAGALQSCGVLGCAKHFPGHGDTASDSHLELPLIPHGRQRLDAVELAPFRSAIAGGIAAVMTAHLLLPELDAARPATLSAAVLQQLLRQELGFEGLVVTDALVMEAITSRYGAGEAAALAFEAGADLILMPADAGAALDALEEGCRSGRFSPQRLQQSLARRRAALTRTQPGPLTAQEGLDQLAALAPQHQKLNQQLLSCSLECQGQGPPTGPGLNLIRVDNSLQCPALPLQAPALLRPTQAGFQPRLMDDLAGPWASAGLGDGPVLLQLFVRGNPFRGNSDGGTPWRALVESLLAEQRLAGLVIYGSPYLWRELKPLLPKALPAVYSPAQMPAAQALALQAMGLEGASDDSGFTD